MRARPSRRDERSPRIARASRTAARLRRSRRAGAVPSRARSRVPDTHAARRGSTPGGPASGRPCPARPEAGGRGNYRSPTSSGPCAVARAGRVRAFEAGRSHGLTRLPRDGCRSRRATPGRAATDARRSGSGPTPADTCGNCPRDRCTRPRETLAPVADSSWPSAPVGATRTNATSLLMPYFRATPPAGCTRPGPMSFWVNRLRPRQPRWVSRAGGRPPPPRPARRTRACGRSGRPPRSPSRRRRERAAGGIAHRTPTG